MNNQIRCELTEDQERAANLLLNALPHGSGFDCDWVLDKVQKNGKFVFVGGFHNMNEHGYYDGWTDIRVIIDPSNYPDFTDSEFRMTIKGKTRYTQQHDRGFYYETIQYALSAYAPEWIEIDHCQGSDYSGCSYTAANYRWFKENYSNHPDIKFVSYHYFGYGVQYNKHTGDQDLLDTINALSDYPCVDDEMVSQIEMEWSDNDWDSWVCSDFKALIVKHIEDNSVCSVDIDDQDLRKVFEEYREQAEIYWESEHSGMYVDVKRVFKELTDTLTEQELIDALKITIS